MTISKAIIDILKEYDGLVIQTEHLPEGSDAHGLFKSPARTVKEYADGSYDITEGYQFFARYSSNSEAERKEADEWLEDLSYWADDYGYNYEFPEIGKHRRILSIAITGTPYIMEFDNRESLYQMSLEITYNREREVY